MNASNVAETMQLLGSQARAASRGMARAGIAARNRALNAIVSLARIAFTNSIMKRSADI